MYFIAIFLLAFSSSVQAQEEGKYVLPVEWQKVQLQKDIEDKINKGMNSFARPGKFLLDVEVTLQGAKTMGMGKAPDGKNNSAFPLDKLGIKKNSKAFMNAISSGENSVFERINQVNVRMILDPSIPRASQTQIRNFVNQTVKSYTGKNAAIRFSQAQLLATGKNPESDLEVAKLNVEGIKNLAEAISKSNDKIAQAIAATQGVELPRKRRDRSIVSFSWKNS